MEAEKCRATAALEQLKSEHKVAVREAIASEAAQVTLVQMRVSKLEELLETSEQKYNEVTQSLAEPLEKVFVHFPMFMSEMCLCTL